MDTFFTILYKTNDFKCKYSILKKYITAIVQLPVFSGVRTRTAVRRFPTVG